MTTVEPLALLRLLHLADSALPIGATPHSFGLETLAFDADITPPQLADFFHDYLSEAGLLDAVFCRAGYRSIAEPDFASRWLNLNEQYAAFKPARESRAASQTLGRRFLELLIGMDSAVPNLPSALIVGRSRGVYHSLAFGLAGAALDIDEDSTTLAYLHQMLTGLHAACQRLMPLGQHQASQLLWALKPMLQTVAETSRAMTPETVYSFTAALDLASMRHPTLTTRLFIS